MHSGNERRRRDNPIRENNAQKTDIENAQHFDGKYSEYPLLSERAIENTDSSFFHDLQVFDNGVLL